MTSPHPHVSGVPDVFLNPFYKRDNSRNCNPWERREVSPTVLRSVVHPLGACLSIWRQSCETGSQERSRVHRLFRTRREFPSQPPPLHLFQVLQLLSAAYISSSPLPVVSLGDLISLSFLPPPIYLFISSWLLPFIATPRWVSGGSVGRTSSGPMPRLIATLLTTRVRGWKPEVDVISPQMLPCMESQTWQKAATSYQTAEYIQK